MTIDMQKTKKGYKMVNLCECSDPSCQVCYGTCSEEATEVLYRIDMVDESGTFMCEHCANDAYESGLFTSQSGFTTLGAVGLVAAFWAIVLIGYGFINIY